MSNLWSHLPNATHIDRVLESIKAHPDIWCAAYDTVRIAITARGAAWSTAVMAGGRAGADTWREAYDVVHDVVYAVAWHVVRNMTKYMSLKDVSRGAILALIMYDDSAKYLDMPSDQLKSWAILSEDPAAVLLLPAVIAYEKISELELA